VKGYQYEPGQYVIIDDEDFAKVKLKSTKVIEIEGFVDAKEVHTTLLDAPYFIGPDGDVAAKTYALLSETLRETGRVGVGRIVLRDRETVVLLTPEKKGILLYKLRYPNEVRSMSEVPQLIENIKVEKEQLKLSKMLVESMAKQFVDIPMKDNYQDALREMIQAKIEGKEIVVLKEEETPVVDIMSALKASIDQAKKKPMEKAKGSAAKGAKETKKSQKASKTLRRKAS
jgi:DNA end-binding protein Ku